MDTKIAVIVTVSAILATTLLAAVYFQFLSSPEKQNPLNFTVSGSNECLRFLTRTVETGYIPFRVGANEKWILTIESVEMPSPKAWIDLYIYEDYWDGGSNYTCQSENIYPIISEIQSFDFRLQANSTFSETFGDSQSRSYTVFFIFPPGGPSSFHIKLDPAS